MEKARVQVKQKAVNTTWDDSPIIMDFTIENLPKNYMERNEKINKIIEPLADVYECQLRWNYYDSLQGNYVGKA
ncbi:hypothetical protein P5808_27780 [Bacillus cereus]|uniref:hypothetical protein n=1 Tax=Bacillus cereus TaxID=1396 RepID=UPI00240712FB|nr:hypothetical protein [Bacillus cereus]MDF9504981.1 hypothetical protein [Bacillus cereus]MDF9597742.1 hypothetical protein [Bacillus cereus]MDF9609889.1 hypothetical protein [Bacillus cereus]MDF9660875.1 hypothetical protein [Bacillus cereus]